MKRRVTMKDVARAAGGVHPSTVSLALRNSPFISEATRERIQEAARELGYRPDPLLDAYNHHRRQVRPLKSIPVIGFLSDLPSRDALRCSPAQAAYWEAGSEAAKNLHCRLELFLVGPGGLGPERLHSVLTARAISCLVFSDLRESKPLPHSVWDHYSAVRIEGDRTGFPSLAVCSDHRQAGRLAVERMLASGHRRPGLALSTDLSPTKSDLYEAGFRVGLAKAGIEPPQLFRGSPEPRSRRAFADWLSSSGVDAVIGSDSGFSVLMPEFLQGSSFASLDLTGNRSGMGIVPNHRQAGIEAVRLAVGLMRANDLGPSQTSSTACLPVVWSEGQGA